MAAGTDDTPATWPGDQPPRRWPDVALQLVQTACTVGGALWLVWMGKVSGEAALAAIAAAGAPAFVRLRRRLQAPDRRPPG